MALSERLYLETGSQKFKMAAPNRMSYISASRQDSEEIPTAICMFLRSGKSIMLSQRLHLETGSQKFKMAAAETGSTCISASIQDS
jgi:hypothetical protein